ncbi:MAG: hypothetical protein ACE5KA_05585 [Nitrososphaerales archaeon]
MQLKHILVFSISVILLQIPDFTTATPVLELDRSTYTPFDKIIITLTDSNLNANDKATETVEVSISGPGQTEKVKLQETGLDTGIFEEEIRLTPDPSKYLGDMQVRRDDGITVSYRVDAENVMIETVFIQYQEALVSFGKSSYQITDIARISVTDRDASINSNAVDTVTVRIRSDTDGNGLTLVLRETARNNGIFEERLLFTFTEASSGNRLEVSDGDTVSVSYVDNTLPAPAKLSADGITTLETKTVVANAVFGKPVPPTQRAPAAEPILLNSFGESVSQLFTGEQVLIQSEVTNSQTRKQSFTYIVQVKDSAGITVSLSWVTSELPPNESLRVAQSWLPSTAGNYSIEIFVWESLTDPIALSAPKTKNIEVLP